MIYIVKDIRALLVLFRFRSLSTNCTVALTVFGSRLCEPMATEFIEIIKGREKSRDKLKLSNGDK